ncbi:c-type cytochrome [Roseococcus sp. DSY-14]|uniref:c-type cytochrome n=1 Tax=Roseococcus sp. DSY-14 TaxID=3369650 RepID=UPI00387AF51F
MRALALLAGLALAGPAAAQEAARAAPVVEARQCGACHGPDGRSTLPEMPSLAGQQPDFLVIQLILFREGLRDVPAMAEPARGLTDAQVEDIAAWFAALPSGPKADRGPRVDALAARGAEVSAARNCNACHGAGYSGRANVPRINHQREDYLRHALLQYRDGTRVGMDTQMNGVMHGLGDADIAALAHHLAHAP